MTDAVQKARSLLVAPEAQAASPWGALFAAGLCASAAVLMAGAEAYVALASQHLLR